MKVCKDFGDRPDCLEIADERYTMDFTDVEPDGFIYWCARCGPEAHRLHDALQTALQTRGSEFRQALDDLITQAETRKEPH